MLGHIGKLASVEGFANVFLSFNKTMRTVVRVWDERPSVMFVVWSIYPGQNGLLGIHNNTTPFSMFLLSYFIHIIVVISNVQKEMPGMNFVVDYPSSLFLL